jgi:protein TonB
VAYRTDISNRDRSGAIAGVVVIHAALLFAVLHHWGDAVMGAESPVMKIFDFRNPPPPPPPPPPPQENKQAKPKEQEGGSPPNIKSEATAIKAVKPKIEVPPLPQIAASETPREGTQATQGAAPVPGPGTGAGGSGNGTGTGTGSGSGGGGEGGVAEPPHLTTPPLSVRDFPRDMLEQWPRGVTVFLRLRVNARGFVSECDVVRGTGNPAIDNPMCNIAHDRLRFRPALNRSGQAVADWFGYAQRPLR